MKQSTHYIWGNWFFSYGVKFSPLSFRLALLYGKDPTDGVYAYLQGNRDKNNYASEVEIRKNDLLWDISRPIYDRTIFTRTTIRHFDYYMEKFYAIPDAYKKLKKYLNIH